MLSKTHGTIWLRLLSCSLMLFVLMACSNSTVAPAPSPTVSPTPRLGAPGCHPPSPLEESNLGPDVRGTGQGMDLWILGDKLRTQLKLKIIWRIADSSPGPLQIVALGPHGLRVLPFFLARHNGSNWCHPGAEYGTGFNFPVAGCWDLHVIDGTVVGDVWIIVSP